MKKILKRAAVALSILGAITLIASVALRVLLHRNRVQRDAYYLSVVRPAEEKAREDWQQKRAVLEAEAKKHPGSIAALPTPAFPDIEAAARMATLFEEPHFRLSQWRLATDGVALGSGLLALYCYLMVQAVIRKELKA